MEGGLPLATWRACLRNLPGGTARTFRHFGSARNWARRMAKATDGEVVVQQAEPGTGYGLERWVFRREGERIAARREDVPGRWTAKHGNRRCGG